jgi:hypothetical protein
VGALAFFAERGGLPLGLLAAGKSLVDEQLEAVRGRCVKLSAADGPSVVSISGISTFRIILESERSLSIAIYSYCQ